MAELDVRTLSVTLRSASGTIGYSSEIYDENYVKSDGTTGASQSDINQDLKSAIGTVAHPINGVATDDKVLKISTDGKKLLSSTLNLKYEKRSGDDAKKIYLTGIDDAVIASIDASDFIKDKFVSKVELITTPESGTFDPPLPDVPYIKITFSDESVIRFGVKDLMKIYDGSNLELSSQYADTEDATPESGKSLDAVIKNLDLRVGTNTGNIKTINDTTIPALSGRVTTAETKLGSVLNKVSASSDISNYITLSASTRDWSNHEQSITLSTPSDTPIITVGSDITNVKNGTGGSGAVTNQIVTALAVNQYVNANFATVARVNTLDGKVSDNTNALTNTIDKIYGGSDTNGFISIGTDYVKASKSTTLTPTVNVATTGTEIATAITEKNDKLASAIGAGEYVQAAINPVTDKITDLELSVLKQVNGSTGTYVTISASDKSNNQQTISATLTTKTLSAASSSSNGLALAYDIKENCTIASVVGSSTYDEWDKIVS